MRTDECQANAATWVSIMISAHARGHSTPKTISTITAARVYDVFLGNLVKRVVRYEPIERIVISGPYPEASLKAIAEDFKTTPAVYSRTPQEYARRVIQMGEDPWRVVVSGALSLDNLQDVQLLDREHFATKFGIALPPDFLLVTYHPVTLEYEQTEWQIGELLVALHEVGLPILFTMPNADTGGRVIRQKIAAYVASNADSFAVENLGIQGYFSVMALASAMVGNSSSGIIEAASFKLPVVNIGTRQSGRVRGINVIDANYHFKDIMTGIEHTLSPDFLRIINQLKNPYGSGDATKTIIGKLKTTSLNKMIILKQYCDLQFTVSEAHEP